MSGGDLRGFYRRYLEMLNAREFDRLDEFFHERVTMNGVPGSREQILASLREHTGAVPDLTWQLEELVVEGDRLAARLLDTGTPAQEWLGLAPTGAAVELTECAFYRVRDGRIEDSWYLMDAAAARRQLG